MKKYFLYTLGSLIFLGLSACNKDKLENYFVKAEENPNFFVLSIPSSAIEIEKDKLDKNTLHQIESIKKINFLLYKPSDKKDIEQKEFNKVESILNSSDYKKLFVVKNEGRQIEFVYQGKPEDINKITFLGRDSIGNFVLGFIKAKNLSVDALAKTIEKIKRIDNHHISELMDEFSKKTSK